MQEVQLDKHVKLVDSPGIVMDNSNSDSAVILRNCVKVRFHSLVQEWPTLIFSLPASKLPGALWRRGGEMKEILQLRLWNLNSASKSPVAPRRLSRQFSANQREAESRANVNKHWKTRAKGNGLISNVISANQHFASTSCELSSFSRRAAPQPERPGELLARTLIFSLIFLIHHYDNGDGN